MDQIRELEQQLHRAITDEEVAALHNNLGVFYSKLGNIDNALRHHKKELRYYRRQSTSRMTCYRFLAECYRCQSKYRKGTRYNFLHLELATKLKNVLEQQRACCNLGNLFLDRGERYLEEDKDDRFLECIEQATKYLRDSEHYAERLLSQVQSDSTHTQGQQTSAKDPFEKAQLIRNYQRLLNEAVFNIGNAYFVRGKYEDKYFAQATEYLRKTASMAKQSKSPILEGKAYSTMGLIFMQRKQYEQSKDYFEKDAQICEAQKDFPGLSLTLRNLAKVCQLTRDYSRTRDLLKKAIGINERHTEDQTAIDEINNELENLNEEIQLARRLENISRKCFRLQEEEHSLPSSWLELVREGLEIAIDKLDSYNKAVQLAELAIGVVCKDRATVSPPMSLQSYHAKFLYYLALGYQGLKKFKESDAAFKQALKLYKSQYEEQGGSEYAMVMIDYGTMLDDFGREYEEIDRAYTDGFKLAEQCSSQRLKLTSLNNLEYIYRVNKKRNKLGEVKAMLHELDPEKYQLSQEVDPESSRSEDDPEDDLNRSMDVESLDHSLAADKEEREAPLALPLPTAGSPRQEKSRLLSNSGEELPARPRRQFNDNEEQPVVRHSRSRRQLNDSDEEPVVRQSRMRIESTHPPSNSHREVRLNRNMESEHNNLTRRGGSPMLVEVQRRDQSSHKQQAYELCTKLIKKYKLPCTNELAACVESAELQLEHKGLHEDVIRSFLKVAALNPKLNTLNLKGNRIGQKCLKTFIHIIEKKRPQLREKLVKLSLASNPLRMSCELDKTPLQLTAFLGSVKSLINLQSLNLSYILLNKPEGDSLFESLRSLPTLKVLKLKRCGLETVALNGLSSQLAHLSIRDNYLQGEVLEDIFLKGYLTGIQRLDFSSQKLHPGRTQNLQDQLRDMAIESAEVELSNSSLPNMKELYLRQIDLEDFFTVIKEERFCQMVACLEVLDLSGCHSGEVLFDHSNNCFFSKKFSGMHATMNIRKLVYCNGDFTDSHVASALRKFLSSLQALENLDLSGSKLHTQLLEDLPADIEMFNMFLRKMKLLGTQTNEQMLEKFRMSCPNLIIKMY